MALGVTDHIWSVAELVQTALEPSDVPPLPRPTQPTTLRPGTRRFRHRRTRRKGDEQTTLKQREIMFLALAGSQSQAGLGRTAFRAVQLCECQVLELL